MKAIIENIDDLSLSEIQTLLRRLQMAARKLRTDKRLALIKHLHNPLEQGDSITYYNSLCKYEKVAYIGSYTSGSYKGECRVKSEKGWKNRFFIEMTDITSVRRKGKTIYSRSQYKRKHKWTS